MENTSGQGKNAIVPPEIDRWNWGAFLLNWIWGLGNNTPIALLTLVPFLGFAMIFVLGVKGNAWAWQNKRWESVEHFKRVQHHWTIGGIAVCVFSLLMCLFIGGLMIFIMLTIKSSGAYEAGLARLKANPVAIELLGEPISTNMFTSGSIEVSGPSGKADLAFGVSGSKAKGKIYLKATKDMGAWEVNNEILVIDGSQQKIDLTK